MIPQAPFEPTYRIFNFNTMPLYPLLIGLGRLIGIDGSWGIKFWPLMGWASSLSLLGFALFRRKLPWGLCLLVVSAGALDPELRWASVLVRPESLIGLFGMALVLGLTFGFPKRFEAQGIWDPIAALLSLSALSHFNAIHLMFPVLFAIGLDRKRIFAIGTKTLLYLTPWFLTIAMHPELFIHQMKTQWTRLAVGNSWLDSVESATHSLFQDMGSPVPWERDPLVFVAYLLWALILVAMGYGFVSAIYKKIAAPKKRAAKDSISLLPASAWVIGSLWLWHTKPEVWFVYYIHISLWCFAGILLLKLWNERVRPARLILTTATALIVTTFGYVDLTQASKMSQGISWRWETYRRFIDCIDRELTTQERKLGFPKPFRVWDPTFPDTIVELSRRHPDWEFTRTNDFWERRSLAIQHGKDVEAVIVNETLSWTEREISGPQSEHPQIQSVWMNWNQYFLIALNKIPGWKPHRRLCQVGRWQSFIYMN